MVAADSETLRSSIVALVWADFNRNYRRPVMPPTRPVQGSPLAIRSASFQFPTDRSAWLSTVTADLTLKKGPPHA